MNLQLISDSNGKPTGVFIPIKDWEKFKKEYKNIVNEERYTEPTKDEILEGIKDAVRQVNLHKEGKINLKSARQLLEEI